MTGPSRWSATWARLLRPEDLGPCEEWDGPRNEHGYGRVSRGGRKAQKRTYVHRETWEKANGPIPPGMKVLHRCDNPPCRRLSHLFLGTQGENVADMIAKGRNSKPPPRPVGSRVPHPLAPVIISDPRNSTELSEAIGVPASTIRGIRQRARRDSALG